MTEAALTRLDLSIEVFMSNANAAYAGVDIEAGDTASFSLIYDSNTLPDQAIINQYSIIGNSVLTIGAFAWESPSFEITVTNDPGNLSPSDSVEFRSNMVPSTPFTEPFHEVYFQFGAEEFLTSIDLPTRTDDFDLSLGLFATFSLRPPSGTQPRWVINGSEFQSISVAPIPEPSSVFLVALGVFILRGRRRT